MKGDITMLCKCFNLRNDTKPEINGHKDVVEVLLWNKRTNKIGKPTSGNMENVEARLVIQRDVVRH